MCHRSAATIKSIKLLVYIHFSQYCRYAIDKTEPPAGARKLNIVFYRASSILMENWLPYCIEEDQKWCVGSESVGDAASFLTIEVFVHLVVCLTTGPKLLPKRALHIVRSRASSFKWEYPLLSLRSFNSFRSLLPNNISVSEIIF